MIIGLDESKKSKIQLEISCFVHDINDDYQRSLSAKEMCEMIFDCYKKNEFNLYKEILTEYGHLAICYQNLYQILTQKYIYEEN